MAEYDQLPQYGGRNAAAPSDVWDAENDRYLTEDEKNKFGAEDRQRVAQEARRREYARREQEATIQRHGGGVRDNNPMRAVVQAKADLLGDEEATAWYMSWLWHAHRAGALVSATVFAAMLIHFAIFHWGEDHSLGRFPIESNFLHGIPPVNDDRDLHNVLFFSVLIFVPFFCMLYHGLLVRAKAFAVYFYDNVLHHMGSAKYLAYSIPYAIVTGVTLVLVGATDIMLIITVGLYAGSVYTVLHTSDWQFGKNVKNYFSSLVSGEKLVIDSMLLAVGEKPMRAGAGEGGVISDAAEVTTALINGTADAANSGVEMSAEAARIAVKLPRDVIMQGLNAVQINVYPTDLVVSSYWHVGLMQLWLSILVLVYYIEANQNSGWHALPWIAHFAFFMFFLPTIIQVVAFALHWFQVGPFYIFAAHEMLLVTSHTLFLNVFAAVVYFCSTQYGTIYV